MRVMLVPKTNATCISKSSDLSIEPEIATKGQKSSKGLWKDGARRALERVIV